jgi:hypothetical protein
MAGIAEQVAAARKAGMSDADIQKGLVDAGWDPKAVSAEFPSVAQDILRNALPTGLVNGITGLTGMVGSAREYAADKLAEKTGWDRDTVNSVLKFAPIPGAAMPSSAVQKKAVEDYITGPLTDAKTRTGKYAQFGAELLPGMALPAASGPGLLRQLAARGIQNVGLPAVGGEGAAQLAEGTGYENYARFAGSLAAPMAGPAAMAAGRGVKAAGNAAMNFADKHPIVTDIAGHLTTGMPVPVATAYKLFNAGRAGAEGIRPNTANLGAASVMDDAARAAVAQPTAAGLSKAGARELDAAQGLVNGQKDLALSRMTAPFSPLEEQLVRDAGNIQGGRYAPPTSVPLAGSRTPDLRVQVEQAATPRPSAVAGELAPQVPKSPPVATPGPIEQMGVQTYRAAANAPQAEALLGQLAAQQNIQKAEVLLARLAARDKSTVQDIPQFLPNRAPAGMVEARANAPQAEALLAELAARRSPAMAPAVRPFVKEPPVPDGHVRFYHGYDAPSSIGDSGARWVTPSKEYAANFRGQKNVAYVDIKKGTPEEIKLRAWDEIDERGKTNVIGRYRHGEIPEELSQQLKPLDVLYGQSQPPAPPAPVTPPMAPAAPALMSQAPVARTADRMAQMADVAERMRAAGRDPATGGTAALRAQRMAPAAPVAPEPALAPQAPATIAKSEGQPAKITVTPQPKPVLAEAMDDGLDIPDFLRRTPPAPKTVVTPKEPVAPISEAIASKSMSDAERVGKQYDDVVSKFHTVYSQDGSKFLDLTKSFSGDVSPAQHAKDFVTLVQTHPAFAYLKPKITDWNDFEKLVAASTVNRDAAARKLAKLTDITHEDMRSQLRSLASVEEAMSLRKDLAEYFAPHNWKKIEDIFDPAVMSQYPSVDPKGWGLKRRTTRESPKKGK